MRLRTSSEPKLILGSAERLNDPLNPKPVPELKLNYSRRLQHCIGFGMTGSGKTESLILNIASQDINKNYGVVIIDGKGEIENLSKIIYLTGNRKKDLYFLAVNENNNISETYNPLLANITIARKVEVLMKSFFEGNPSKPQDSATAYYIGQARQILNFSLGILEAQGKPYNFKDLYYLITEPWLLKRLSEKAEMPTFLKSQVVSFLRATPKDREERVSGLLEKLSLFIEDNVINSYKPTLNIKNILDNSKILLVSLTGTTKEVVIGKLVLQDIENSLQLRQTTINKENMPNNYIFFDEFGSYIFQGFTRILSQARSAKIGILVSTQSFGDLTKISPEFTQSILDNCSSKFILRQDSIGTKEIAEMLGEALQPKGMESWSPDTIARRLTEDYDFIVRPEAIKDLMTGEGIASLPRTDGIGIYKVKFNFHQELQNKPPAEYNPRPREEAEGLNLEKEVEKYYQDTDTGGEENETQ